MSEHLDRALDRLAAGESPRDELVQLDADEQKMVRMAQLLRGSRGEKPDPTFVSSLRDRIAAQPRRVSRRTAFLGGLGALAAGVLGGIGLDHLSLPGRGKAGEVALVGAKGRWFPVARADDVPPGAVLAFTAGHVQGFLINRRGDIRALSRICTHMGCRLDFEQSEQTFVCPCHGAEFTLSGEAQYGPGGYGLALPPLPTIRVRQNEGNIEVWSI